MYIFVVKTATSENSNQFWCVLSRTRWMSCYKMNNWLLIFHVADWFLENILTSNVVSFSFYVYGYFRALLNEIYIHSSKQCAMQLSNTKMLSCFVIIRSHQCTLTSQKEIICCCTTSSNSASRHPRNFNCFTNHIILDTFLQINFSGYLISENNFNWIPKIT